MPIFTRTFQIIAGVLSIPVVGAAIIGSAYTSPFLNHLADITNGNTTSTVVSLNAPNWSNSIPLAQVVGVSTATTTGSLASSTPFSFAVAALDSTGTTTLSSAVTLSTDPNGQANEGILVSWAAVSGATGYAVYEATGTVSAASGFTQYFLATSTNGVPNTQFTMATTTGSLSGSYTKSDTTAFADKINPVGASYFNGGSVGFGTSSPASSTPVDVYGYMRAQVSGTTTACYAATAGAVFYNTANSHEWGCNGTTWTKIF
jgi:hypothetical protein